LINSFGEILSLYFIVNIRFINVFTFYDTFISDGNFKIELSINDTNFGIELYSYGQIPYNISYNITPIDHISALLS